MSALIDINGLNSSETKEREKAKIILAQCKEKEKKEDMVTIRIDKHTVKRMPRSKAIRLGLIES